MGAHQPAVVIGGGIVGTAIAYELQRAGCPTILVERDLEPRGASAFSFASLSAFDEPQTDAYLLKAHGLVMWRELTKRFGEGLGASFGGELRWAESEESADHLSKLIERAKSRGYPARSVSIKGIEGQEPAAHPVGTKVASLCETDGQADPTMAIETLRDAFSDQGGMAIVGKASLVVGDDSVDVRVGEDLIQASTIVLATGAETDDFLGLLGWKIPMEPSPGLLCVTEPCDRFLNGTVYVYPRQGTAVHLRQRSDGRVMIGEKGQDTIASDPTLSHARSLLDQARRSFSALQGVDVDRFTVEWRPMPRDGKPIVGWLPGLDHIYVATGHSGVTIAPALAGFVAEEIVERTSAKRLEPFRVDRFSRDQADVHKAIEEAFASEVFIG